MPGYVTGRIGLETPNAKQNTTTYFSHFPKFKPQPSSSPPPTTMPPRCFKKTARMSTGGLAPHRVLATPRRVLATPRRVPAALRQPRRRAAVLPRRSARIARRYGIIDAITESVIIQLEARSARKRRQKMTARRYDGLPVNRVQLATRAAELADAQRLANAAAAATAAAVEQARRAAATQSAARPQADDAITLDEYVRRYMAATLAAHISVDADMTLDQYNEHERFAADMYHAQCLTDEAAIDLDPDETDTDEGIFSDYEPSSPAYRPVDQALEYYGIKEEDDIQCAQPLSPIINPDF